MPKRRRRTASLLIEALESRRLLSVSFDDSTSQHTLTATFDHDVSGTLMPSGLFVTNLANGQQIPSSQMNISFDGTGQVATITFPGFNVSGFPNGVLADGNYEAIVHKEQIGTAQDESDVFHFLDADFNHDTRVNALDFNAIASNFGTSGATYAQGDADYNGNVDSNDFTALATRFNTVQPPPPNPATNLAIAQDPNGLKLTWNAPIIGSVTGYRIFRSDDGDLTYTQVDEVPPAAPLEWVDSFDLKVLHDYHYLVRSYTDAAGGSVATLRPLTTTPKVLVVSPNSEELDLAWVASTDPGVDSYAIYRSTDPNFTASQSTFLDYAVDTHYEDAGLIPATTYYYKINAVHADGSQTEVDPGGTTLPADRKNPLAPQNFAVDQINDLEVQLTWDSPKQRVQKYRVEESLGAGQFFELTTLPSWANTYTVRFAPADASYRVVAVNSNGAVPSNPIEYQLDTGRGYSSMVVIVGGHFNSSAKLDLRRNIPGKPERDGFGNVARVLRSHRNQHDGFNTYLFAEDHDENIDATASGIAYDEIQYEIENRGIHKIALVGFSHGGGIVKTLAEKLRANYPQTFQLQLSTVVYVDPVIRYASDADPRSDPVTQPPAVPIVRGLDLWEDRGFLFVTRGFPITGNNMTQHQIPGVDHPGIEVSSDMQTRVINEVDAALVVP